jgi:ketose-bisphosphate aldolase
MPVIALSTLLAEARREGYALPYAESWNLESLQAVIESAEQCSSPIIAGFNGGFLRHRSRHHPENLAYYACFRQALEKSRVPIAFLLNESDSLDQIREGIELGFNAVMPESDGLDILEYRDLVKSVMKIAKPRSVFVEAQVGVLPAGGNNHNGHGVLTDPACAAEFVEDTGVDALAISIGNIHVLTSGKATIDLETLRQIRERVSVPLVVHGGTSLTAQSLGEVIRLGVTKVNFGTCLKQAYLAAIRGSLEDYREPLSPHSFLGIGGPEDIMTAGREAVKLEVAKLIDICGSKGRAKQNDLSSTV